MQALAEAMQLACDAALAGDLDAVKTHLTAASHLEGYSINAKGIRSRTPLYQSCLGRNPEVALWLLEQGAQDEKEGCGYVAICATGKGGEDSADNGERTAAIMRRFGFAGKPKKVKKKKQKKNTPPMEKQKKKKKNKGNKQADGGGGGGEAGGGDGRSKQRAKPAGPAELLELAVAAAAAGDTAPLLAKGNGKHAELPIHHAARTSNASALAALLATDCAKEQLLSAFRTIRLLRPQLLAVLAPSVLRPCPASDVTACRAALVSGAGRGGKLPAHYAVERKDVASLQLMITVGGAEQLLQPDSNGRIPLQYALSGSSAEVPLALLAVRARYFALLLPGAGCD
jgi:hypothetical protein